MTNQINNERYLVKLHQDILKIMDEVERICTKFHLCYYLMGGSCLGAIRHNGFIPWDDDLDIVMPRADFDRFIALLSDDNNKCEKDRVLGDGFFLRWISTEKSYNLPYAKVCLKGTKFQEINGLAAKSAGIFVDVFPLDSCGPYGKIIKLKSYFLSALNNCLFYKGVTPSISCLDIKQRLAFLLSKVFSNHFIYAIMLAIINFPKEKKAEYQAIFVTPYPINRMLFPQSWHGEGKRVLFEGRSYVCPNEARLYLSRMYGDDYMEIPPVKKRKTHYPFYVVFSDGEEMIFEEPKQKVEYKDILS